MPGVSREHVDGAPDRPLAAGPWRRPTIRSLSFVLVAISLLLPAAVVGCLIWATNQVARSTAESIRHMESVATTAELSESLLAHQRLSNLFALTGEPGLRSARQEVAVRIRQSLLDLAAATDTGDRPLLDQTTEAIVTYLRERHRLEVLELDIPEVLQRSRESFEGALSEVETLERQNQTAVVEAHAAALQTRNLATVVATIAMAILFPALLLGFVGLRRFVLRPLSNLHGAIERFRDEGGEVDVPERGAQEIAVLARTFNEMAGALARQRKAQLDFLAGVAHDLRTPLSAVKAAVELAEAEHDAARRAKMLSMIDRQVDRLARMSNDLLDATRIEAGHLELEMQVVDLRECAQEMVALYRTSSSRHQISLEEGEPVMIHADRLRLEQVIGNLLSNAIKFSPDGGDVEVAIAAESGQAVLTVHDHGIGMTPEEQRDIFAAFQRSARQVAPGSGIGLSVVRRIVVAHGGNVEVCSAPGEGSTFRIRVPLARVSAVVETVAPRERRPA